MAKMPDSVKVRIDMSGVEKQIRILIPLMKTIANYMTSIEASLEAACEAAEKLDRRLKRIDARKKR